MDVYSLLSIVKSYYRPDNYDLHKNLCIASKKYYEFTKDLNIDKYFNVIIIDEYNYKEYRVCGKIHRLRGPALIYYASYSIKEHEEYYINGKRHRENGPAYISYHNGSILSESYYIDDKLHRENSLPAHISYCYKGSMILEIYCVNGKRHRVDGPAYIRYLLDNKLYEIYYINGKRHREDGLIGTTRCSRPAHIEYNNGSILVETYYSNDKIHREDGPAQIHYFMGSVSHHKYYIDDILIKTCREN